MPYRICKNTIYNTVRVFLDYYKHFLRESFFVVRQENQKNEKE
jgi:hypothetical protein